MALSPPPADLSASASNLWKVIDRRIQDAMENILNRWGRPRARTMTINFPIAGATVPLAGWVASCGIANNIKIVGWEINAIIAGTVSLDVQVSTMQTSPATSPARTSLNGVSNYLTMTAGFTTSSQDTSTWTTNLVSNGAVLHLYVISATTLTQAILVLRVIDMDSKVLQP